MEPGGELEEQERGDGCFLGGWAVYFWVCRDKER